MTLGRRTHNESGYPEDERYRAKTEVMARERREVDTFRKYLHVTTPPPSLVSAEISPSK